MFAHRDHRAWGDGRGHPFEHSSRNHGRSRATHESGPALSHEQCLERPLRPNRFADKEWPFDQEPLLVVAGSTITGEPPQSLDLRVVRA
jgi:hypothetical protein